LSGNPEEAKMTSVKKLWEALNDADAARQDARSPSNGCSFVMRARSRPAFVVPSRDQRVASGSITY
jgi:hypothetical protein